MNLTLLDLTARGGHTWQTGHPATDCRLSALRAKFGHRARHWPADGNQAPDDAEWVPAVRAAVTEYDALHRSWADSVGRTVQASD